MDKDLQQYYGAWAELFAPIILLAINFILLTCNIKIPITKNFIIATAIIEFILWVGFGVFLNTKKCEEGWALLLLCRGFRTTFIVHIYSIYTKHLG